MFLGETFAHFVSRPFYIRSCYRWHGGSESMSHNDRHSIITTDPVQEAIIDLRAGRLITKKPVLSRSQGDKSAVYQTSYFSHASHHLGVKRESPDVIKSLDPALRFQRQEVTKDNGIVTNRRTQTWSQKSGFISLMTTQHIILCSLRQLCVTNATTHLHIARSNVQRSLPLL